MTHILLSLLRGRKSPIADGVVYLTKHGSTAYGTNVESSDQDYKGIGIPPKEYYLSVSKKFEQQEMNEPDMVIFELRKFFSLLANNNPNTIECLYTDPTDHEIVTDIGEKILAARDIFLSKTIRWSFGGYAHAQLHRIKQHRSYLLNPLREPPKREDFGLKQKPEISKGDMDAAMAMVQKEVDRINFDFLPHLQETDKIGLRHIMTEMLSKWSITKEDRWLGTARTLGFSDNFTLILQKEKEYLSRKRQWEQYLSWEKNRNVKRHADEAKFGYDLKHGYHLLRLSRMSLEILQGKGVIVKRPDREDFLAIRRGEWSYEKLIEEADKLNILIDEAFKTSMLPAVPNMEEIDKLCQNILEAQFFSG